jgi:CelD/BcsL family acetyltransferase involved in cellulose biosynthesis
MLPPLLCIGQFCSAEGAGKMDINRVNPLQDRRWKQLLQTHPAASVFRTPAWLDALRRTYGYEPVAFTTSSPSEPITDAIVFCRVQSWLTGSRLVSVPFADHCQTLFCSDEGRHKLTEFLPNIPEQEHCDYIELRLLDPAKVSANFHSSLARSATFAYHWLDLRPEAAVLYSHFHKSCFQRKIKRAEREGLAYATGTSDAMLQNFYRLLVMTRRRHGVPPQPLAWFRNLRDCFDEAFQLRMALLEKRPIAGIITLQHNNTVVYKYGGSDASFHKLGAMPFLFWQTIQQAKSQGATELDLGRSDSDRLGLIAFKDHMGAASKALTYFRHPAEAAQTAGLGRLMRNQHVAAHLPNALLKAAGNFLYRHIG